MTKVQMLFADIGAFLIAHLGPVTLATAIVLGCALLADRLLARRIGAGWRSLLFVAVLVRALLPLDLGFGGLASFFSGVGLGTARLTEGIPTLVSNQPVNPPLDRAIWFAVVYGVVATLLFARWIWARAKLAHLVRMARPASVRVSAMGGAVSTLVHPTLGPLVAGILRPVIVLPAALAEVSDDQTLKFIVAHERAHIARLDHLVQALWQLVCIVAWPIVPLWIAARRQRTLAELACDERALAGGDSDSRRRYAEILIAVAQGRLLTQGHALAPSFGWELPQRLRALGWRRRWNKAAQVTVIVALAPLLVACTGSPKAQSERADAQAVGKGLSTQEDRGDRLPGGEGIGGRSQSDGPQSLPGEAMIHGGLHKEIVRRIVRRHINEVKYCYEHERAKNPGLEGRVVVTFTVGSTGAVIASVLKESTVGNPAMESCLVMAPRRWEFPKPQGGGVVEISYPFSFAGPR